MKANRFFFGNRYKILYTFGLIWIFLIVMWDQFSGDEPEYSILTNLYLTNKKFLIITPVFYLLTLYRYSVYSELRKTMCVRMGIPAYEHFVICSELLQTLLFYTLVYLVLPVGADPGMISGILICFGIIFFIQMMLSVLQLYFFLYTNHPYLGLLIGFLIFGYLNYAVLNGVFGPVLLWLRR